MCALEVEMQDQVSRVGARFEVLIQRGIWASSHWYGLHVAAYASVDEKWRPTDLTAVETEKSML
jgi:hypothetical protein